MTTPLEPPVEQAPLCYGLAAAYSLKSEICKGCSWRESCGERAGAMMKRLRSGLADAATASVSETVVEECPGKTPPIALERVRVVSATSTASETTSVPSTSNELPKNARKLLERLARGGIDLQAQLDAGVNPFDEKGPEFLRVVFALIQTGPFSRRSFRDAFVLTGGVTEGTAASHVSFTVPALIHLGVIEEVGGVITRKSR